MTIGTPTAANATKILLLGSGELGKEVALEAMRLGCRVIACDNYADAPAMQVAHESHIINMFDRRDLVRMVKLVKPHFIVPEVEAIATDMLLLLEQEGSYVVPNARATALTMNRESIRRLVAEELHIKTAPYRFADIWEDFLVAVDYIKLPCVIKPVMSSSGRGQSIVRAGEEMEHAWHHSQTESRTGAGRVIVESFIKFDYEVTLLTVRHRGGTTILEPVGHRQENGDYQESWQPHPMAPEIWEKARDIALAVTDAIGGWGIFGVELFVLGSEVFFNEVSPRPHDTGMVTMISQNMSEFELHVRAFLGLPIGKVRQYGPSASSVICMTGTTKEISYVNVGEALSQEDTKLRIFGKPEVKGHRRMGVALALGDSIEEAREKAAWVRNTLKLKQG
jgi:phosphoribosylglycinamide formyltransferase 2